MTIHFPGGGDPVATAGSLRALADDLERLTMFIPGRKQLADAPLLDDWNIAHRGVGVLAGLAHGHPLLGTRRIVTSEIYAIDTENGWARTFSRFYRLNQTLDQECQ